MSQTLTPRETEVLSAIAQGKTNREIAAALGITMNTVKTHTARILLVFGAATRAEAVARWKDGG